MSVVFNPVIRKPGEFQQGVTLEDILAMCTRGIGSCSDITVVTELGSGLYNNVYRIEFIDRPAVILRVSPTDDAFIFRHEKGLMRREYAIQPWLASCTDIIPKFLIADFTGDIAGRDYAFQNHLSGDGWSSIKDRLSEDENEYLWKQLGAITARFHSIKGSGFGLPHLLLHCTWSEYFYSVLDGMYWDLLERNLDTSGVPDFIALARRCSEILDEVKEPAVVHGDLWEGNILVGRKNGDSGIETPRITGVLDFDRCTWGDPLAEGMFTSHPASRSFCEGYGWKPEGRNDSIRALLYQGRAYIQVFLEAWRYKWDDRWCREGLGKICRELLDMYKV